MSATNWRTNCASRCVSPSASMPGTAIAGSMGYGRVMGVTVIGDTVNIASRLESVAKELDASVVLSSSAAVLSGVDFSAFEKRTVDIRGHSKPLKIIVVPQDARVDIAAIPAGASLNG